MKIRNRALVVASLASGVYTFGCGSVASLTQQDTQSKKTANASANLTEEAAATETAAADEQAQATDAGTDDKSGRPELPEFLKVVEAARAYTRSLLGLDDAPLKEFMATVEAAKALATSPEDFKTKIEPAKKALKDALDAQKTAAEQARVAHADELKAIFDGTVAVFKACAVGVDLKPHRRPRGEGDGPVVMIGNGEFDGNFADMLMQAGHGPEGRGPKGHGPEGYGKGGKGDDGQRPPRGPRPDGNDGNDGDGGEWGLDDASTEVSAECTAASAALQALIPST